MCEMTMDTRHKELNRWLLEAIGKVRHQKQRPSIERICVAVQQKHADVTADEVSSGLDCAIRSGAVICVENKGAISYRQSSCLPTDAGGKPQQSSDAGDRMPSLATISEAVVLAVREIGSGCSQDMIEQHVKKYCQDASGLQSTDLHSLVTDACKALVSTRRFSSRDGLFYMKSSDELALSRASSTSLLAADRQLPSTTFTDPQHQSDVCCICHCHEDSGGSTSLLSCSDCSFMGHASCLKLSPAIIQTVKLRRWQCQDCKTCTVCKASHGSNKHKPANKLIMCIGCDRAYHVKCCKPPMAGSNFSLDKWLCGECHLTITQSHSHKAHQIRRCNTSSPDCHLYSFNSDIDIKSPQSLVSQRTLVPVVRQLDSCQSEAVVGSSSDVASSSRSRRLSSDIEDHSSPATSPEADSHVPVQRPAPRGLVDALSRYFTPSDKRRSRVSLNALPHASPRSLPSRSHSLTSAADTTHTDDASSTRLPPKRRYRKKSEFSRPSFWKRGNATDLNDDKTRIHSISGKSDTGEFQPVSCDSPTSQLSLGMCLPSESKPKVISTPVSLEMSSEEAANSEAVTVLVREDVEESRDSKQRKRRRNQLSSLHDSLSHFFSAEGERKRTPVQYMDSEFSFETYQPFDYHTKHVKRQQSSSQPQSLSNSLLASSQARDTESPAAAASWPSTCFRLSNYHSSVTYNIGTLTSHIEPEDVDLHSKAEATVSQESICTSGCIVPRKLPSSVVFGCYLLETACPGGETMYVCEFCLASLPSNRCLKRHTAKCGVHCPLGDEVYRDRKLSVYLVDGLHQPAYCRTLCILSAMFGAKHHHPSVQLASTFYILTQNDRHGCHLVAFFSSQKRNENECVYSNLCILPPYQGSYDVFLIDFGYQMCKACSMSALWIGCESGSLGELLRQYWTDVIISHLGSYKSLDGIAVKGIASETGIHVDDVRSTLKSLDVVTSPVTCDIVDINRCRVNDLRNTASLTIRSTAALFFKPTHLKLPSTLTMSAALSPQETVCTEEELPVIETESSSLPYSKDSAPLIKRRKVGRPKKKAKITMKAKDMKMTAVPGRRRGRPRKHVLAVDSVVSTDALHQEAVLPSLEPVGTCTSHEAEISHDSNDVAMVAETLVEISAKPVLAESSGVAVIAEDMPKLERKDAADSIAVGSPLESRSPSPPTLQHKDVVGTVTELEQSEDNSPLPNFCHEDSEEEIEEVDVDSRKLTSENDVFLGVSVGSSSAGESGRSSTVAALRQTAGEHEMDTADGESEKASELCNSRDFADSNDEMLRDSFSGSELSIHSGSPTIMSDIESDDNATMIEELFNTATDDCGTAVVQDSKPATSAAGKADESCDLDVLDKLAEQEHSPGSPLHTNINSSDTANLLVHTEANASNSSSPHSSESDSESESDVFSQPDAVNDAGCMDGTTNNGFDENKVSAVSKQPQPTRVTDPPVTSKSAVVCPTVQSSSTTSVLEKLLNECSEVRCVARHSPSLTSVGEFNPAIYHTETNNSSSSLSTAVGAVGSVAADSHRAGQAHRLSGEHQHFVVRSPTDISQASVVSHHGFVASPVASSSATHLAQFTPAFVNVGSPSLTGTVQRGSCPTPGMENVGSPYASGYRRLSSGSGSHIQPHLVSPEMNIADQRMHSPAGYCADFTSAKQGSCAMRPLHDASYQSAGGPHSVKSSPGAAVGSPGSGCAIVSPSGNYARAQSFGSLTHSPATRIDQSPASAGSGGFVGSSSGLATQQGNFNQLNPSPSGSGGTGRGIGGGSGLPDKSPIGSTNVFSPAPAPAMSPSIVVTTATLSTPLQHSNVAPFSCSPPDGGLPFQFPTNVAVPVSATTYANAPSPTPHSLQLLSPSNNRMSAGYQTVSTNANPVRRHPVMPHQQLRSSAVGLPYYAILPSPPSSMSYAGVIDHRFVNAPLDHLMSTFSAGAPPSGRQTAPLIRAAPSDCSIVQLQQLTNRLSDYSAQPPEPFSRGVGVPGAAINQACKQSGRRRTTTADKMSPGGSVPLAPHVAGYNMLDMFQSQHQQVPHATPPLNYQQYLANAGFFGQGSSQLPMQMMPFGPPVSRSSTPFTPQLSSQAQGASQMYPSYNYGRTPSDAFTDLPRR